MTHNFTFIFAILAISTLLNGIQCKNRVTAEEPQDRFADGRISRGIGISAWGLVFLIIMMILLGVAAYYVALFYPLICKKERKYNRIELTTV